MRNGILALAFTFSVFFGNAQRHDIEFTGLNEYSLNLSTNTGTIKAARITNYRNGGTSGTLFLQVWMFSSPYSGYSMTGYKIANVRVGELKGGWQFNDLSYSISWDMFVPEGNYYLSFIITEYDPNSPTGYYSQGYVTFSQPIYQHDVNLVPDSEKRLQDILNNAGRPLFSFGNNVQTEIVKQDFSAEYVKVSKSQSNISGLIEEEWSYIPWDAFFTINAYENTIPNTDILMLDVVFSRLMGYSYKVNSMVKDPPGTVQYSHIYLYVRRSDRNEAERLIRLIANNY